MTHHRLADHREEIYDLYFEQGESLQAIGDRFGKSREAVRLYLNEAFKQQRDKVSGVAFRKGLMDKERLQRAADEQAERERNAPRCVICGDKVLRRTGGASERRTCSPECAQLWVRARFLLDPELNHRRALSQARSNIKHQDKRNAASVNWARNLLEAAPRDPSRGGRPMGAVGESRAHEAYLEVMRIRAEKGFGPELVEENA